MLKETSPYLSRYDSIFSFILLNSLPRFCGAQNKLTEMARESQIKGEGGTYTLEKSSYSSAFPISLAA
uniref:hypothetical protein n=1 Tax=Fulvivirga sp. TaxID=1931237 RepID=UPI00404B490A